jgi:tetratricopeptide (TPR) repeat protein
MILAKGIVTGHGMSWVHGPIPEPARKFPPGYPAILAIPQLISRDNVILMKSLSVFFFALCIPLTWLVIREIDTEIAATIVACSALLSPHLIEFSHQVLSEIPYAAVSLAGVLFLIRNRGSDDRGLLVVVVLAVASYYVRTIGLTMIGAVVCVQFLDRRYKHGFLMGTAAAAMIAPWVLQSSAYLDQFSSVNPYQTESSTMVSVSFLVDRISQNLDSYGLMFFPKAFAPFMSFRPPHTWVSNSLAVTVDLLILYFMVMTIRRSRLEAPIGVYLLLYFIVVLLWPEVWADTRFVVPIIPLAIYALLWSARDLINRIPIPERYGRWAPYAFSCIVLLSHGSESARTQIDHAPYEPMWANYFQSAEWIKDNTPEDALIACRKPFLMNVLSGRKTMSYPWVKPIQLLRSLNDGGTDWVVSDVLFGSTARYLNPTIAQYPESFRSALTFRGSKTHVFKYLEHAKIKQLDAQLAVLNKTTDQDPNDKASWRALYALGTQFHSVNDLELAREIYERVLPVLGKDPNILRNLGILHFVESRYNEAIDVLTDALEQSPDDVGARLGLAQAHERVGNWVKASDEAKRVYRQDAKSAAALHTIARCADALGNQKKSAEAFFEALGLEPESAVLRIGLAALYSRDGRYDEASTLLDKGLLEGDPKRVDFRLKMITRLTRTGHVETAQWYVTDLLTHYRTAISQARLDQQAIQVLKEFAGNAGTSLEAVISSALAPGRSP